MSFVVGFVTGMATGESVERRRRRRQFREYMSQQGFRIVDQHGSPVPLESVIDQVLKHDDPSTSEQRSKRILMTAGIVVAAVVITGGSAWAVAAAVT